MKRGEQLYVDECHAMTDGDDDVRKHFLFNDYVSDIESEEELGVSPHVSSIQKHACAMGFLESVGTNGSSTI